jgi:hypothetical protein
MQGRAQKVIREVAGGWKTAQISKFGGAGFPATYSVALKSGPVQ